MRRAVPLTRLETHREFWRLVQSRDEIRRLLAEIQESLTASSTGGRCDAGGGRP